MKDPDTSTACFQHKYITAFFYAAFAIPLAAQLFSLVQEAAHPTELKTTMKKESLSTFDDFPLLGRICVNTGLGWMLRNWEIMDTLTQGWAGMTFGISGTGTGMDNSIP